MGMLLPRDLTVQVGHPDGPDDDTVWVRRGILYLDRCQADESVSSVLVMVYICIDI